MPSKQTSTRKHSYRPLYRYEDGGLQSASPTTVRMTHRSQPGPYEAARNPARRTIGNFSTGYSPRTLRPIPDCFSANTLPGLQDRLQPDAPPFSSILADNEHSSPAPLTRPQQSLQWEASPHAAKISELILDEGTVKFAPLVRPG